MNLIKKLLTFAFIFCLNWLQIAAQPRNINPEQFSVINGLPNNEVRCLLKDSKGYIWIGTLYGLAKYDGNKFTIYKHESNINSISGDVISAIFEDNHGNILIGANGLSILEPKSGKWQNFLHNPDDPNSIASNSISSMFQENDSIYWLITQNGINRFNLNSKVFSRLKYKSNIRSFYSGIIEMNPDKSMSYFISSLLYRYNFITDTFQILPVDNRYEYNEVIFFKNNIIGIKRINPKTYTVTSRNLVTNKELELLNLKSSNNAIFHDNANLFLINNNILYVFDGNLKIMDVIAFQFGTRYDKSAIDYFCGLKEKNGTLWIGTSNGLYKIPKESPFHMIDGTNGLENSYIRALTATQNGDIFIGVRQGPVFNIKDNATGPYINTSHIESLFFPDKNGEVYATNQILELKNGNLIFVTQNALYHYRIDKKSIHHELKIKKSGPYFSALEIPGGVLIGSLEKPALLKLNILPDGTMVIDRSFIFNHTPDVIYTLFEDSHKQIWIGGEGLYKLKIDNERKIANAEMAIPPINELNLTNNSVWNIIEIDSTQLMVATTTNGFYIYNKVTNEFKQYNKTNGLPTDFTCAVLKDHHNNFWMSTKEGISFIDGNTMAITNYTIKNGPFNCDFNFKCCAKTNTDFLLFGSKQGIVYFNPDSIKFEKFNYQLMINEFRIFDDVVLNEIADKDTIVLLNHQNFFTFDFSLLDFRNPGETHYRYQLIKYDKTEHQLKNGFHSASYTNVPPGKYQFNITGYSPTDSLNQQKNTITVIIKPAYYQTAFFKFSIILTLILITATILMVYIRRQVLKGQLYKMELDVLRSQIDPHFIFNTLTSIQHTILTNSKNVAIDHLSKFARLMRMGLDYSRLDYISLEKAIQFYKTYVAVESVNLDEEIDFQVQIDKAIDPGKFEISPMLIQPFIENSIVHGLSPKNKNMHLQLSITQSGKLLVCILQDNGIGRALALEITKKKTSAHQSMGIDIIRRRIILQLQQKSSSKDCLTITDNYDNAGMATGTTVELRIPFKMAKI